MNDAEDFKQKVEAAAKAFHIQRVRCKVLIGLIGNAESKGDVLAMVEVCPDINAEIRERDRLEREFVVLRSRLRKRFAIVTQFGRGMSVRFSARAKATIPADAASNDSK